MRSPLHKAEIRGTVVDVTHSFLCGLRTGFASIQLSVSLVQLAAKFVYLQSRFSLVPDVRALAYVGGARLCSPCPRTQEPGRLVRG